MNKPANPCGKRPACARVLWVTGPALVWLLTGCESGIGPVGDPELPPGADVSRRPFEDLRQVVPETTLALGVFQPPEGHGEEMPEYLQGPLTQGQDSKGFVANTENSGMKPRLSILSAPTSASAISRLRSFLGDGS